ncbi:MAG: MBL fold metallo-hydrolase [Deltaproteobacteria bacterium]|nr:MBL fold metallo-hydrolase [Deltaproteobacteria bacterium]
MKAKLYPITFFLASLLVFVSYLPAQDLGPYFKKIKEGIYVRAAKPADSNAAIILTQEGVVLIDSGHNPPDSQAILKAVKQLTPQPIRYLINTEPHGDHTTGHFVFSPPAVIVAHEGATDSMKKAYNPKRNEKLMTDYPDMRESFQGFKMITPHIEYRDKMTLHVGERTLELYYLKNVHSESDTAIWLPKERVLFSAAVAGVNRFSNLRSFVSIPDMLSSMKMMKALNPEIVVPGHGAPGTVKIFEETERYYELLLDRVGKMAREGRSLDQIKKELRMPEYDDWASKERFGTNIEAAYRAVKK